MASPAVLAMGAVALGAFLFLIGILLLRRLGPAFRVARLLRTAPEATIGEAVAAANSGQPRYLRVRGRVRSDEEFPDEHDRPLVYRRSRIEVARGGRWEVVDEERLAVPFGVEDRASAIEVDVDALGEGLVVLPRESLGRAADLGERMPAGVARDTPARLRIDQVSAVEHAVVVGVPGRVEDRPVMTAGLGRPLIVATLDLSDAMRVLAGGDRRTVAAASVALATGSAVLAAGLVALLAQLVA